MKTLLIDNGTTLVEKLKKLLPGDPQVTQWDTFQEQEVEEYDLIILSGGSVRPLKGNEHLFARELHFLQQTRKPVIGICFGCELIVKAFGGDIRPLSSPHRGIRTIQISTGLLGPSDPRTTVEVYEQHQWIIDTIPEQFNVLAWTSEGPEMIRHQTLPIVGIQFHPENFVDTTDGDEIFFQVINELRQ